MVLKYNKYINLVIFLGVLYVIFLLVQPFISAILSGLVLAYAFSPLYAKINYIIKKPRISSAIVTLIIFLIIVIPIIFLLNTVASESVSVYNVIKNKENLNIDLSKYIPSNVYEKFSNYSQEIINKLVLFLIDKSSKLLLNIPGMIFSFFLIFFLIYYILQEGGKIHDVIKSLIPFENRNEIFSRFERLAKALIYGTILVAFVQGLIGGILFYIFKTSSPILFGVGMAIASFIPVIGTAIVWIPVGLFELLKGNTFSGIGILVSGALIISTIDNVFRSYFVSYRTKVHPVMVFLGVIGGLRIFGLPGIIVGPLLLSLTFEFIKIKVNSNKTT